VRKKEKKKENKLVGLALCHKTGLIIYLISKLKSYSSACKLECSLISLPSGKVLLSNQTNRWLWNDTVVMGSDANSFTGKLSLKAEVQIMVFSSQLLSKTLVLPQNLFKDLEKV
jgi:hypothetical protein